MKRVRSVPLVLLALLGLATAAGAGTLTPEERQASVRYVQGLRNADGGFRAGAGSGPSSLGSTSSALRALKYFGGARSGNASFLRSMVDGSGGLRDSAGGECTVRSTATGLMAAVELDDPLRKDEGHAIRDYFARSASTLSDVYIAAAALDAAGLKFHKADAWIRQYQATKNPDGTYGQDATEHAGAVITLLRLGTKPFSPSASARALTEAQLADGGWAAKGDRSDLSATYRVMRALRMLKARPDLARVAGFIKSCRNGDGGYGPQPGQPSAIGPTYFAAITLTWVDEMAAK